MFRVVLSEAIASAINRSPELTRSKKKFYILQYIQIYEKYTGMKYLQLANKSYKYYSTIDIKYNNIK